MSASSSSSSDDDILYMSESSSSSSCGHGPEPSGSGSASAASPKKKRKTMSSTPSRTQQGRVRHAVLGGPLGSIEYRVLTQAELLAEQAEGVSAVTQVFALPGLEAARLLQAYAWQVDVLVQALIEAPEKVAAKVGVASIAELQNAALPAPTKEEEGEGEGETMLCLVCYCDVPVAETFALRCGHTFCSTCWGSYVGMEVREGRTAEISCMGSSEETGNKCTVSLDDRLVERFITSDPDLNERYSRFLCQSYVASSPSLKWCPSERCEGIAILCDVPEAAIPVRCLCGFVSCFRCGSEDHLPASCKQVKTWLDHCEEESANAQWIMANTKPCPKCGRSIQKNGGCQHMVCGTNASSGCGIHFCWNCLVTSEGSHLIYNHSCSKYKDESGEKDALSKKEMAKRDLARFIHHHDRYANHNASRDAAAVFEATVAEKMEQLQQCQNLTWNDVQYIADVAQIMISARTALKYSYVFGYYLPRGTELVDLFEYTQEILERETEQLAFILEQQPVEDYHRMSIVNQANLVQQRIESLLDTVATGMHMAAESGGTKDFPLANASSSSASASSSSSRGSGGGGGGGGGGRGGGGGGRGGGRRTRVRRRVDRGRGGGPGRPPPVRDEEAELQRALELSRQEQAALDVVGGGGFSDEDALLQAALQASLLDS